MEKERDGVKGFESRERSRRQQEKEARGRGQDPLRDSPIDKSDVSPDLSPGGTRRDPEAIAKARNTRINRNARKTGEKGKGRSRAEYDEKMKVMKKDMAELKTRVNKLEKTVSKQAEKLKSRERGSQERENERGRDRQRTMERGRDR